ALLRSLSLEHRLPRRRAARCGGWLGRPRAVLLRVIVPLCALAFVGAALSAREAAAAAPAQLISTTTTLTSSQNPTLTTGTPSITATVSSTVATPNGAVVLARNSPEDATTGTPQFLTAASASSSLPGSPLQAGTYTLAAVSSASGGIFADSPATPLSELVNKVPTTTTLTSSQNPTLTTGTPSITATVSSTVATPNGAVV